MLRKGDLLQEHVAGLAMLAGHGEGSIGLRQGLTHQHGGVARLIGDRPGVVAHPPIDRHVGADAGDLLATAQSVEGHTGGGHQGAARFTQQAREAEVPGLTGLRHGHGHGAHPVLDRRGVIRGHIADPQSTAHIEIGAGVAQGAGQGEGVGHHGGQVAVGLNFKDLRADVGMEPIKAGPAAAGQMAQDGLQLVGIEAELAVQMAGADVLVGVALDARGEAHHQPHRGLPTRSDAAEDLHVMPVVDHHGDLVGQGQFELLLGFVVAVQHDPLRRHTPLEGGHQLSGGNGIEPQTF